ncbi:CRISPR-associated protein Csx19 [Tychonema sp. LEGE 07203]|uniref:type III-D CRISPR-associated protein Csx19 n=1 Tax=Tychonema sp. LEGE 07203 TaxID=1828671 RepID=UPI001D1386E6|nr:CRISPR-associated protein Csx19 [Tychonema sp. LEGE 07203]
MKDAMDCSAKFKEFADDDALYIWLEEQARFHQLPYLLAHADDGVIWGSFDKGSLTTAEKVFYNPEFKVDFPKLRLLTLQQCRVFGENGEIFLWQSGANWKWRFIGKSEEDKITESQILYGTQGKEREGFTLLSDGSQGLRHAVPLTGITFDKKGEKRPVRLLVHHYITCDDTGVARIYLSRLVHLTSHKN